MFPVRFPRRRVAGALVVACVAAASDALAQQSLPVIDIGATLGASPHAADPQDEKAQPAGPSGPANAQPLAEDNVTYHPENAISALKTNTPIMETPASIQVVPRAVLEDQKFTNIGQAVNNVSGVIAPDGRQALGHWVRGFLTYSYYKDGVRFDQNATNNIANTADVDRVEVLKGPASILYGRGEPGGLVNLVTKQPLEKPYTAIEQQIGSWGSYRTTLDTTGPLTKDGSILYRFNGAWDDTHLFYTNSHGRDYYLAPKLRWNIDAHTNLTVYSTYKHSVSQDVSLPAAFSGDGPNSVDPIWRAVFGTGGAPWANLPRNYNGTQPWGRANGEEFNIGYAFSHDLNEDWNIRNRFHIQLASFTHFQEFPGSFTNNTPFEFYTAAEFLPRSGTQSYYSSTELTGNFDTLGVGHTLLVGFDYEHFAEYGNGFYDSGPNNNPLGPVYLPFRSYPINPATFFDYGKKESWWGAYLQDQIRLPYNFFVLAGGRFDHVIERDPTTSVDAATGLVQSGRTTTDKRKATPRFGLLWRPVPEFSLYGSYLTNFGALNLASRSPVPPESAWQWEVGAKAALFDKRVTATIAYYDLTKTNIASPDPADPTGLRVVTTGEARNRGVEFDVAGEISPGWKVIGAYSYIASIITRDGVCNPNAYSASCVYDAYSGQLITPFGNLGKRYGGVPRHSGSVWTSYDFTYGLLQGLKIGGGAIARSLIQVDNFNSAHLPGYVTLELFAAYTTHINNYKTTFQINVENALDTRYYQISYPGPYSIETGAPLNFKGSVKVEF
jgi:iron complex outermembrane recepter protein